MAIIISLFTSLANIALHYQDIISLIDNIIYLIPPTKLDGGYVFTPVCLFVCSFLCLLAGLLEKLLMVLDQILWGASPTPRDKSIKCWC